MWLIHHIPLSVESLICSVVTIFVQDLSWLPAPVVRCSSPKLTDFQQFPCVSPLNHVFSCSFFSLRHGISIKNRKPRVEHETSHDCPSSEFPPSFHGGIVSYTCPIKKGHERFSTVGPAVCHRLAITYRTFVTSIEDPEAMMMMLCCLMRQTFFHTSTSVNTGYNYFISYTCRDTDICSS